MKTLKLLIIIGFLSLGLTTTAQAQIYKCIGTDTDGARVNAIYDDDNMTLTVDDATHKLIAPTNNNNGLATENYETEDGRTVYDSLVVEGKDKIKLYQFDAKSEKVISKLAMTCL